MNAPTQPQAKPTAQVTPSASKPVAPLAAPPFRIGSGTSETSQWLKLLAYGKAGSGKTTLLGTAADIDEMQDILYLDLDKGALTMHDNPRIKNADRLLQNRILIDDFMTVSKVYDFLVAHCKARDSGNDAALRKMESILTGVPEAEIEKPKRFRTVLLDSLTELDVFCNYGILGVNRDKILKGELGNIEVAGWPEFRKNNYMMQMILRAFRDLPIHVLTCCQEQWAENEQKKRFYQPTLTGQLRTQVLGFFDVVGYMYYKQGGDKDERKMYVKPVGPFEAKNRRASYDKDFFDDPYLIDIMRGTKLLK